jgi:uncharacterized protein YebE (UPF0316 family)
VRYEAGTGGGVDFLSRPESRRFLGWTRSPDRRTIGRMAHALLGGFLIFLLRLGDVPLSTVRTMLMVQGRKLPVAMLAICESAIWIVAISRVLRGEAMNDPYKITGYAVGFATGTVLGMLLEQWLAIGKVLVRVISQKSVELRQKLIEDGFGVTSIRGEGKGGEVFLLFIVTLRKREKQLLRVIQSIDPKAFITREQVGQATGGFVTPAPLTGGGP